MTGTTPRLGMTLPGGGAQNKYGPPDPVDIDKISDNFSLIDAAIGLPARSLSSVTNPFEGQFVKSSVDGELYYNVAGTWTQALPSRLQTGVLPDKYVAKGDYTGFDARYYTQDQLLNGNVLDGTYPAKDVSKSVTRPMLPFRYTYGINDLASTFSIQANGKFQGFLDITFTQPFASAPAVVANAVSGDYEQVSCQINPGSLTATGCRILVVRRNNIDTGVNWIAIGVSA